MNVQTFFIVYKTLQQTVNYDVSTYSFVTMFIANALKIVAVLMFYTFFKKNDCGILITN